MTALRGRSVNVTRSRRDQDPLDRSHTDRHRSAVFCSVTRGVRLRLKHQLGVAALSFGDYQHCSASSTGPATIGISKLHNICGPLNIRDFAVPIGTPVIVATSR
jgi:hypothetical protein